jgi:hypothetical protein
MSALTDRIVRIAGASASGTHVPGGTRRRPLAGVSDTAATVRRLTLLLALLTWPGFVTATDDASEYRVKAGFLYNFAAFTEWPAQANGNTLWVCVYGDDPFGNHLDSMAGRRIGERSIDVRRAPSVDQLSDCSLIFVTRPMIGNLPRVLDQIGRNATLVVADSPSATTRGAMLNMEIMDGKVSFSANLGSARRQNLNLSARLLSLATEVIR